MDLNEMGYFIEYKPVFDDKPILDTIISLARKYIPEEKMVEIVKAYDFAKKAHEGVVRLSGEPYIIHPLEATEFLMELNPDIASIQACILHDVIEDTSFTYDDIKKEFGEDVAHLCEGLVKVSKIKYKGEDRHLETIKKTFLAMAQDLRVIFIKLADRIHNIQTLQFHPNPSKITKIAEETMKIFVPIAKRLGLYHFQLYLENGAFRHINEKSFNLIIEYLKKHFGVFGEKYIDKGIKIMSEMLRKEGIHDFIIKGRLKSPYRIYEKMETKYQGQDLSNVMDLLAYRVITKNISDCYMVLGIIHKYYTPLIKKIKDYIAIPKFNGYKSIHTTILGMFNFPIEIQIRTEKMDEIAEHGVAAHFGYSENHGATAIPEQQAKWIEKLQETVEQYTNVSEKETFKQNLNLEVLNKSIFLYTPNGDVKELSKGSTVLDFAFSIHSDIGLKFKNAIVNGTIKPINFEPKNGDVVQINIFRNNYSATKHWLDFLHTSLAKSQLSKFLKAKQKEGLLEESAKGLNKILKEVGVPNYLTEGDKISKFFKEHEIENKLLNVLTKTEKYSSIIKEVYPKERHIYNKALRKDTEGKNTPPIVVKKDAMVIVDNDKILNYQLCPECNPIAGDRIIAKTGKDGIKIHKMTCKALKTVAFEKLMEAHRQSENGQKYKVYIQLQTGTKYDNIFQIMTIFTELQIPILKFAIDNKADGTGIVDLETEFTNPTKLSFLLTDIKKNYGHIKVLKRAIT